MVSGVSHEALIEAWEERKALVAVRDARNEAREEVAALQAKVAGLEAEVAAARVESAAALDVAMREKAEIQKLADHRGVRLVRFQEGTKVVDVEMKRLLQQGFDLWEEVIVVAQTG